jgi:hypothetical protein
VYLVEDERHGAHYYLFTVEDPRKAGYRGNVIEGVTLDYDMEAVHSWPDGQSRPEVCLGQAPDNPKHFKVFKYNSERQSAGYLPVPGTAVKFGSWADYLKVQLNPPDPEQTPDEDWYAYFDKVDEAIRQRRRRVEVPAPPAGSSRDDVAAWVAKRHRLVDSSIREVWYLPRGAPSDEIRLLEVNERFVGPESKAEAIDFGLDIEGARFRLFVADVTSEQLDQIKQDPSRLPPGWTLDGKVVWRRGA